MVTAEDVISIYKHLLTNGIKVWLTGGWGIDALLGEQTRQHKDLDVLMLLDDVHPMCELLASDGYRLKELWSENRWTIDTKGTRTATAFVLIDSKRRELDVHALRMDGEGNGIPEWAEAESFIFSRQDFSGQGMIAGYAVRCMNPENQMFCHTGYELPENQTRDLQLLHDKFSVELPRSIIDPGQSQDQEIS
jgi:lincosamide nucleotidyltransferase A/C/D/E